MAAGLRVGARAPHCQPAPTRWRDRCDDQEHRKTCAAVTHSRMPALARCVRLDPGRG